MEKKRLTKTMWYGSDVDHAGNAILPEAAASDNHLSGLNEGEIYIHNHPSNPSIWTRTTDGKIVSISGVDISVLEKLFLSKTKDDRSKGKISSDKAIEVGNYVSGASGAIIYKDAENGQTVAEFDKLYVRMKAYFETLEIINVNTIGGKQIISPAGSVKCIGVEETDNAYRCYFLAEQDGEKVQNRFLVNDQIYSQMFDAVEGTSQNVSTHYFWRLCIAKSKEPVTFENKSCHYIDLSKTDCDKDSDVPMVGDVLNQRGNRTDLDRMNFIEMSSVDAFSPNITLFHGVNSYSLDGKAYVSYGVDKSTNKAFMDVYGDMYVGDRQNTSYMRYTQEKGLEISGTLSVSTKLGDTPLKDLISASSPEGYQEFVEKVTQDIEGLQAQIDGAIESYFFQYDPTLGNYPASEWIANGTEKAHLNDTFTNVSEDSGHSWRWSLVGTTYNWVEIKDTATAKALQVAGQAKDTADGKRRVFVDTPYPPYDKGDLWSRGSEHPLMICVKTKDKNGAYEASDFDYADNNAKLKEEIQELVGDTKDELNNAIGQAKNEAVNNANAYTDAGKQALQASIDAMEQSKANLDDVYTRAQADGKISESETNAINAAKNQADAAIALSEITIKAYADGIVDEEEAARIKQAQENLDAAKEYAKEQAQKAIDEANDTYGYLAKALGTEVDGGLLLTSLIQMRDTDQNIMSGINGLTAKGDKSIATWWGGGMYDMFNYYDWDGAKWVAKKNIQIPSNVPSGVIRMDGTGYLAKGKFWWDDSGKIYADPTALFLSFDVEAEAGTLSATIIDIRDKQIEFADMWEFKTDANGRKYLLSKYPLVTQEGVTMYSGASTTIPSIYDGLPIDGTTIYWENGVLKAQGGGGGTITEVTSAMVINALGYTPYDAKNPNGFITSSALSGYQPLITSSNKLAYSLISGTPTLLSSFTNDSGFITSSALNSYLPKSGGTINGGLTLTIDSGNPYLEIATSDGSYLGYLQMNSSGVIALGSGFSKSLHVEQNGTVVVNGTNTNPLNINTTSTEEVGIPFKMSLATKGWVGYSKTTGTYLYNNASKCHFSVKDDGSLSYSGGTIFHSGNFNPNDYLPINANAVSASKLKTPRTIWGQSFDGTGNVSGHAMGLGGYIDFQFSDEINRYGGTLYLQHRGDGSSTGTGDGATGNLVMCRNGGYVGIGIPKPAYNLDVNGTFNVSSNTSIGGTISVIGKSTFNNDVDISQNLAVSGTTTSKNLYLKDYMFMNDKGEGIYLTNNALSWHNSSNAYSVGLLSFDGAGLVKVNKLSVSGNASVQSLSVNGGSLTYDPDNRHWKLNGNLLVTGGIAMYSDGSEIGGGGTGGGGFIDYPLKWSGFSSGSYDGSSTQTIYIPSKLSELTNDSGYALSSALSGYLPLSGGTLKSSNYNVLYLVRETTAADYGISLNFSNSNGEVCNLVAHQSTHYFSRSYNGTNYAIWDSGNFNPSDYLPLAGGVLSDSISFGADGITQNNTGTSTRLPSHIYRNVYDTSGNVYDHYFNQRYTAATNTFANLRVKTSGGMKVLRFGGDGTFSWDGNTVIHSGNIGSQSVNYASNAGKLSAEIFSDANAATYTDRALRWFSTIPYTALNLPTTAGYQNGLLALPLHDNGATAQLYFSYNQSLYYRSNYDLDWNEIAYTTSNVASATNADKVDGYHSSSILTYDGDTNINGSSTLWDSFGIKSYFDALPDGLSSVYNYGQAISFGGGSPKFDIYVSHISTNPAYDHTTGGIYVRSGWNADKQSWRKLAFMDGNVASATKLQTSRSIWGQSFDGSSDISGNLSGVWNLYVSSAIILYQSGTNYLTSISTSDNAFKIQPRIEGTGYNVNTLINPSGGNVGIGTTSPSYKLDVLATANTSAYDLHYYNSSRKAALFVGYDQFWYGTSKTNESAIFNVNAGMVSDGSGGNSVFRILGNGNVGIGTSAPSAKLHVTGNILTSGSITMNSMRSMKNIINENGLSLEELSTIKPTRFTWKDGRDDRIHVGGIADDVMKVLPEVVFKGRDGVLSMDYASAAFVMTASLIQPMTEHDRRIANLERENALLKEEIRNLKSA